MHPDDSQIRHELYQRFAATGSSPTAAELAGRLGTSIDIVSKALHRLHNAHALVLQPSGEVLMANPFSAVPTPFPVRLKDGRNFYGNCIWDALGIFAMLKAEGSLQTSCGDCGESLTLTVNTAVECPLPVVMHFALPARRWWEDIVFN